MRIGPPVFFQFVKASQVFAYEGLFRAQIGVHISAARPENRLLGISDDEQLILTLPSHKKPMEDPPLNRIRILELIDNGKAIPFAKSQSQSFVMVIAIGIQSLIDSSEHVLETLHTPLGLVRLQVVLEITDSVKLE